MRLQIDLLEKQLKKIIANNLKSIMKAKGITQSKLSELSGIPQSTISDIIKEKFLVNAGKVQQLADSLKVPKSEIDPSFESYIQNECERYVKLYLPVHIEVGLELDELYYEGKKLSNEEKEKIKEMLKVLFS
ncbi:helix-turn-helix transcriptional regulator [Bacillus sp. ISL-75]|uniref:helix-turn-helix domain-containing protein n=1 Tax=Bacillus sp. ISL-75 TaxID=2819137 RepID=UPI001BED111D|nr:helix-turn-helix transcriptional regulator [Bacillus sp. ISL-75]MBT2728361.1 helix-turn-helix transcriptional regulator [Bacillus sp. ISL-75]